MRYQMVLQILDDEGNECGALLGAPARSPTSAARDVITRYRQVHDESEVFGDRVAATDELKWAARRFGA